MTFENLKQLPDDPILQLPLLFQADAHPDKVNLGIGVYRDAEGKPLVLTAVRDAEARIGSEGLNKEYQPIEGGAPFLDACKKLIFDASIPEHTFSFQALGGTGALRVIAEVLAQEPERQLWISDPTWPNHPGIFTRLKIPLQRYPYYNAARGEFDWPSCKKVLETAKEGDAVLWHVCCHNPTGADPTRAEWKEIADLCKNKRLFPFFDAAYLGFADSFEADTWPIRYFAECGLELGVAVSFSKNMGLYGERAGFGSIVVRDRDAAIRVASQGRQIIRNSYSNPPLYVQRILTAILTDADLTAAWLQELADMRGRVLAMREALHAGLLEAGVRRDISRMMRQRGLFSLLGISSPQVEELQKSSGIFLPKDGRLCLAGLNEGNLPYVCRSLARVLT